MHRTLAPARVTIAERREQPPLIGRMPSAEPVRGHATIMRGMSELGQGPHAVRLAAAAAANAFRQASRWAARSAGSAVTGNPRGHARP